MRCLLVERVERQDARFGVAARTSRVDANDRIFLSAERADTSLVDRDRHSQGSVSNVQASRYRTGTRSKQVAALAAASRVAVVRQKLRRASKPWWS